MMTVAYNETYLPSAMHNLATMMDCGVNKYGLTAYQFFSLFLKSGIAKQFAKGNPRYVVGISGVELADAVIERTNGTLLASNDGSYSETPEFWAGWVLAYYQWKTGKSFYSIQHNGLGITKIVAMYHPLHEADLEKFVSVADEILQ
ncbi:MAG: hypothetical protein MJ000_02145 [Bacteroidales bacterium]|nr:hypothetical protein [Bacteroidales bacterium]